MELRRCQSSDLQAIIDLNEAIYAALPDKSVLRHNSPEMIASCLEEPNVTLGIWDGSVLVAIGMLYVPLCLEEDHFHDLDLQGDYKSANQKLFLVRESYRGQGLQRRLIREVEKVAVARGFNLLCTTVAPNNDFSINNFLKEGYVYAKTEEKYGGLLRNLYYKIVKKVVFLQPNHINKYNKNNLNHYTMKKLFAIVALIAAMSFAGKAQAQIVAYLGYAPETFKTTNTITNTFSGTNFQGFFLGGAYNIELPFLSGLGVAPGLQFRLNTRSDNQNTQTQTLIDIPILVDYVIPINKNITVAPFVGPMLSLALSGTSKNKNTDISYPWYGENGSLNRFNLYGVVGAEGSYANFMLFLGYRFGFFDIDKLDISKTKANGFFVGLGYSF